MMRRPQGKAGSTSGWALRFGMRRGALGWIGSAKAIDRLKQATSLKSVIDDAYNQVSFSTVASVGSVAGGGWAEPSLGSDHIFDCRVDRYRAAG